MNLNDIIQAAQGGQGLGNLASQFGLSPQQTQSALDALLPAFSTGLQNTAGGPGGGIGDILSHMMNTANQSSYTDPQAAQAAAAPGGSILGQIFGGPAVSSQVAQHASQVSGVAPDILKSMLPVIASMVMGGMFHNMQNQGFGGILGQLAGAAMGGAGAQAGGGGMGGMGGLGNILGQMMGGGQQAAAPQPAPAGGLGGILGQMMGGGGGAAGGGQNPALQAGMDALSQMFNHGTQVQAAHQQGLQDIFAQMMQKR